MRALRERRQADCHHPVRRNFNPRSPYGEGHPCGAKCNILGGFNPRSPYGERPTQLYHLFRSREFQSTLPVRGATPHHAHIGIGIGNFNPRSPYGERLGLLFVLGSRFIFQSTLPVRGATSKRFMLDAVVDISIYAPRTGSDCTVRTLSKRQVISIHAPRTGSD